MIKPFLKTIIPTLLLLVAMMPAVTPAQDLTAKTSAQTVAPQRLTVERALRSAMPLEPKFMINSRQAGLRDHHLTKSPLLSRSAQLAPVAPQAVETGPATSVLPTDVGADSPVIIIRNHALNDTESGGITSTVNEPSAASSRSGTVLYTANWFAAISKDDGESFRYLNPTQTFPQTGGHAFCCDQVALYDPVNDILFWFLQYVQNGTTNIIRLAYAQGTDIDNETWRYYDFTPQSIGGWNNEWFDFPDLAVTAQHIYISTNSFSTRGTPSSQDDGFARAVMIRLPLAQIAQGQPVNIQYFDSEDDFSFRPTHGATDVMYFASHDFNAFGRAIKIYSWPEANNQLSLRTVQVDPWSNSGRVSVAADGNQWLRRADFRMSAAWVQGKRAGFAWNAAQDDSFAQPHMRVAIVDMGSSGNTPLAQPHLWNKDLAFAYMYAAVNSEGAVGVSVAYGGGGQQGVNPSHAVGVLAQDNNDYRWRLIATHNGSDGPADGRWGDYLSVKPHGRDGRIWVATGFTLSGGSLAGDVLPRLVYFQEPTTEPIIDSARKALSELRKDVETIRDQVNQLLQKITDLQSKIEDLQ